MTCANFHCQSIVATPASLAMADEVDPVLWLVGPISFPCPSLRLDVLLFASLSSWPQDLCSIVCLYVGVHRSSSSLEFGLSPVGGKALLEGAWTSTTLNDLVVRCGRRLCRFCLRDGLMGRGRRGDVMEDFLCISSPGQEVLVAATTRRSLLEIVWEPSRRTVKGCCYNWRYAPVRTFEFQRASGLDGVRPILVAERDGRWSLNNWEPQPDTFLLGWPVGSSFVIYRITVTSDDPPATLLNRLLSPTEHAHASKLLLQQTGVAQDCCTACTAGHRCRLIRAETGWLGLYQLDSTGSIRICKWPDEQMIS